MALWHRIRSTRLGSLSHQCRRWYSPFRGAAGDAGAPAAGLPEGRWRSKALECPLGAPPFRPTLGFEHTTVRSFAAPVQAKSKPKPAADASDGPRINGAITAAYVRLVTDEGHGIVSIREALDRAMKLKLDLVEVQRTANPPVCKIMDFHREKYKQEVKEKERAKTKSALTLRGGENKEVRFKAKTELKDLKTKADQITRLMERGYRVKCMAMPMGKEDEDLGDPLSRLLALIEDVSVVESGPHVDSRHAYVIVRHIKFTTKKSGKKASKVLDAVSKGIQSPVRNTPSTVSSIIQDEMPQTEEEWEPTECSSATEGDYDQVEANAQHLTAEPTPSLNEASDRDFNKERGWPRFNATNDFKKAFGFDSRMKSIDSGLGGSTGPVLHSLPEDNSSKPSNQKFSAASVVGGFPASKPGLDSLKAKMAMKEEPSIVEINRYIKRSDPKGRFHQTKPRQGSAVPDMDQGRMPPEPTRSESQRHDQADQKQRQFHPSNSASPSPSYGSFRIRSAANQGRSSGNKSVDPSSSPQSYGIFNAQKTAASGDQRNLGDSNIGKSDNPGLRKPSYGIFTSLETLPQGSQANSGDESVSKPENATSQRPRPSYGIFCARKPAGSSEQGNMSDANPGKANNPSSSPPRYGIFSATDTPSTSN
ncbi:translation initiation factor IF3-1, mitochondrial [Phoenix dactylifera]|uniref:Translation initiation factor IF3-1, mitochondrial n=1 Tax=Phoenix dactylifera TaxID=42345 RepID=A0A8B7CYX5_PHODC|nr:translation initiation factor IF3-1, mitochondrial [Phoenix dactylifera]